jgi:hypothetical protein
MGWPKDYDAAWSFIISYPTFRKWLSLTELPGAGFVEGDILFVKRGSRSMGEDDLIVQIYLDGEEFLFRFSESAKIPPPNGGVEQIDIPPPQEI